MNILHILQSQHCSICTLLSSLCSLQEHTPSPMNTTLKHIICGTAASGLYYYPVFASKPILHSSLSRRACFQYEDMRDRFVKSCPPTSAPVSIRLYGQEMQKSSTKSFIIKQTPHGLQRPKASENVSLSSERPDNFIFDIPHFHRIIKENYLQWEMQDIIWREETYVRRSYRLQHLMINSLL